MKTKVCSSPECGNIIAEHNKSGLCGRCNSSKNYWSHRPADAVTQCLWRYSFFQSRLSFFVKEDLLPRVRRQQQRRQRRRKK